MPLFVNIFLCIAAAFAGVGVGILLLLALSTPLLAVIGKIKRESDKR